MKITSNLKNIKKILLSEIIDYSTDMSDKEVKQLLSIDYSEAYKKMKSKNIIFRGIHGTKYPKYWIQEPRERKSAYTSNHYNILFSEILSSWSEYPKRNNSIICTSNSEKAEGYNDDNGIIYKVFPKNGSKLGITSKDDIWYSFNNSELLSETSLNYLNHFIDFLIERDIIEKNFNWKNLFIMFKNEKFQEIFKSFINPEENPSIGTINRKIGKFFLKNANNLYNYINEQLDPNKNGFQLITINNYNIKSTINNSYEIWTESPCLLIRNDLSIKDIIKIVE
jgi:hypothetical protein